MITTTAQTTGLAPRIGREHQPGLDMTVVNRHGVREFHITLRPRPGERTSMMLWRLDALLRENGAAVVRHEIFGSLNACAEFIDRMERMRGDVNWPVTCVEGGSCAKGEVAGMHVLAVSGVPVKTVSLDGRVVGRVFNDRYTRHCLLGDVGPEDLEATKEVQAAQTFENIEAALERAGMKMNNLVRTWLFLRDILSWYGPFNGVRKDFFARRQLFDGLVPASTGVGVGNPAGAALVVGAWAMQPNNGGFSVREVASPLQCPARSYGSCFSRAVEIGTPNHRRLLVSGTASIEPGGRSARLGDVKGQINLTMNVVEAILASRGMGFSDVTRATAYFKKAEDAALLEQWCHEHHTFLLPVAAQASICRDELLFELEVDAMATSTHNLEI